MELSIGSIVRKARKERHLSQKQVGALAGLSYTMICHIECDRFLYGEESLTRVCKALKLDVNELLSLRRHQYTTPPIQVQKMISEKVDEWYMKWKDRIVPEDQPHRLGIAKEELKNMLCTPYDERVNNIFDIVHGNISKDSS